MGSCGWKTSDAGAVCQIAEETAYSRRIMKFIIILILIKLAVAEKGSCREARKCCDGKDADCVVQKADINAIIEDYLDDEPCYCDHGCMEVGDCCPDFKDYCGVIDCQVSEWSEWSKCNVACGKGTSTRTRQVLRPESNGGLQCPHVEEKQGCKASKCSKRRLDKVSAHRETAMLLPGKYATTRSQNYDVRSNLRSYTTKESETYCVVFRVDKAMKSCSKKKDTNDLSYGNTVCVQCDNKAQRGHLGGRCQGHGAEGKRTRFKNILTPRCHGKWTRMEITTDCQSCKNGPDFIFV